MSVTDVKLYNLALLVNGSWRCSVNIVFTVSSILSIIFFCHVWNSVLTNDSLRYKYHICYVVLDGYNICFYLES